MLPLQDEIEDLEHKIVHACESSARLPVLVRRVGSGEQVEGRKMGWDVGRARVLVAVERKVLELVMKLREDHKEKFHEYVSRPHHAWLSVGGEKSVRRGWLSALCRT